jgi:tRNA-specific 2-thiouridylase
MRPGALDPGDIVHVDGEVVGQHQGIINYTVGQRRGLGIGGTAEPLYVVKLEPEKKQVIVGPKEALARNIVYIKELNWLGEQDNIHAPVDIWVKLRSVMQPIPAQLQMNEDDTAEIWLAESHHGIAPGQAAVFYDGDRVLGGGWIVGAERAA